MPQMNNSYILWMAWRYIVSRKGRSLSFMTTISILGVAIGVAALVVVLSVMGGFEQDLRVKMFRGLPHMEILAENSIAGFSLKETSLEKIQETFPDANGIEPFTQSDVVLKQGKNLASITLFGIDPEKGGKLWGFSEGMKMGQIKDLLTESSSADFSNDEKLPGIILGESLASNLGAEWQDTVFVLSPQVGAADIFSGGHVATKFRITGIFQTDLPRYDSKYAIVSLPHGRKFMPDYDPSLDTEEYVSGIALNLIHPEEVGVFEERLKKEFPGLQTLTWKNVNKSLLLALNLEKFTMGVILLLIVLVAAFSISGTMMMTVFHKRNQIALLSSLGMQRKDIAKLYLAHGFGIGCLGVILGLAIGLGICILLNYFQLVNLPPDVYYLKKLPVKFLPVEYVVISFCAWLLSLLAALYPAIIASKQDPGMGLRYL